MFTKPSTVSLIDAPFSRSVGVLDPSPPAMVPAPYGLPPWTLMHAV